MYVSPFPKLYSKRRLLLAADTGRCEQQRRKCRKTERPLPQLSPHNTPLGEKIGRSIETG